MGSSRLYCKPQRSSSRRKRSIILYIHEFENQHSSLCLCVRCRLPHPFGELRVSCMTRQNALKSPQFCFRTVNPCSARAPEQMKRCLRIYKCTSITGTSLNTPATTNNVRHKDRQRKCVSYKATSIKWRNQQNTGTN
jgi:hypothetical protein